MPSRPVNHHHDALIGVACRDFIEEQLHAPGVDVRQDQTVELARTGIHRTLGVGIFVSEHGLADWAHWLGRPAPAHVRDAPKARLVLEHQLDVFALRPVLADNGKRCGEFFFHAC